ncbi:MAG: ABC transporter permease [Bacteroidales bacterium]|nr:ABC transporter permease [Bacteroidales bacterium]
MKEKKSLVKKGRVVLIQLKEGISFTWNELKNNKFRTFLSLLGVSIGIFTIVAIFTAIDALKSNVKKGFESLSSNQIQVSKWPLTPEDEDGNPITDAQGGGMMEYRWWDYMKRPDITINEYKFLKANSKLAEEFLFSYSANQNTVKYGRNSADNVTVMCETEGLDKIMNISIDKGRMITKNEFDAGSNVCILGCDIATSLFQDEDPVGKAVKIKGYSLTVVGVTQKQGGSMIDLFETDKLIFTTYLAGKNIFNFREPDGELDAIPKEGVTPEQLTQEMIQLMRQCRRIRPGQKNNFSINQFSTLEGMIDQILGIIRTVGWIIAAFSLLIGGFGIANIMFVSVKERTKIIGIQKALGAKRYFIMTQFLAEALILAVAGALAGILLIAIILWIAPIPAEYDVHLTFGNILSGVAIASIIGILSGILPAWSAAKLNPVDAINSK